MHHHTPPDTNLPEAIDQFLAGNPACSLCQGPRGKDDIIGIYDVPPRLWLTAPYGHAQHIIYTLCEACSQLPGLGARVERKLTADWN